MLFHAVSCNGWRHKAHNFRLSHSLSTWEELKRRGPTPWFCLNIGYPKIQIWLWLIWSYLIFSVHCSTPFLGPNLLLLVNLLLKSVWTLGFLISRDARRCAGTTGDCSTTAHLTGVSNGHFHRLMDHHHSPWFNPWVLGYPIFTWFSHSSQLQPGETCWKILETLSAPQGTRVEATPVDPGPESEILSHDSSPISLKLEFYWIIFQSCITFPSRPVFFWPTTTVGFCMQFWWLVWAISKPSPPLPCQRYLGSAGHTISVTGINRDQPMGDMSVGRLYPGSTPMAMSDAMRSGTTRLRRLIEKSYCGGSSLICLSCLGFHQPHINK